MSLKKLEDVFKRSGIPSYTFVEPAEYNRLIVSLRTRGRSLVIEGPSGIGKTTCVLKALDIIADRDKALILSGRKSNDLEIIYALPEMGNIGLVIIDDFHRLEDLIKQKVADYIKTLADEEVSHSKIVIIGINKAGLSLIKFAHDLTGRIDTIRFESNPLNKISELIEKGESALKIRINIKEAIAIEAQGSFHIAQMLCHETCLYANILEEQEQLTTIDSSIEVIRQKVLDEISDTFKPMARKFATGPRLRPEGRAPYFHLLFWLAQGNEWSLQIDESLAIHTDHKGSVGQIVEKGFLIDHLTKNPELSEIIHYDHQTKTISIEDPKFVYFIRNILWSKFSKEIGYRTIEFKSKYDFALSFAGSDRDIAEALFGYLTTAEMNIFYDRNEQHSILASNVEDYLGPIYSSEAQFVIALLGPDYPKRIWTKFESDQFKDRFGDNSVIPIWFKNAPPGIFDETTRYGGLEFDRDNDFKSQIEYIGGALCKKMDEERLI